MTLYIEEKTGVESNRVIPETDTPLSLITADKADLVFAMPDTEHDASVFQLEGFPALVSGERPFEDIQFTTVLPALQKLERLMTPADVMSLVEQVRSGKSAMAAVRKYFMEHRLI